MAEGAEAGVLRQWGWGLQDVVLVMYLANLVQTQIALADKLGTMSLPLV